MSRFMLSILNVYIYLLLTVPVCFFVMLSFLISENIVIKYIDISKIIYFRLAIILIIFSILMPIALLMTKIIIKIAKRDLSYMLYFRDNWKTIFPIFSIIIINTDVIVTILMVKGSKRFFPDLYDYDIGLFVLPGCIMISMVMLGRLFRQEIRSAQK